MSVIDELTVLITADSSGIEKVLKSSLQKVQGTVNNMNSEEVDWTSIFTRSVSPAIISGVASMFAMAIASMVSFNSAAKSLDAGAIPSINGLADSSGLATSQMADLSYKSGANMTDAANSFIQFSRNGLDSAAATQAVIDAQGIAYDSGESLSVVTAQLSTLFNNWGVHTLPQVTDALTGLINGMAVGGFTFNQLADAISQNGSLLQGKTNIAAVSEQLGELSQNSGLSQANIIQAFDGIAQASAGTMPQVTAVLGNIGDTISKPGGLIDVFGNLTDFIQKSSPLVSSALLTGMSIDPSVISGFKSVLPEAMGNTMTAYDTLLNGHIIPLQEYLDSHKPFSAKVMENWNNFTTFLGTVFEPLIAGAEADYQNYYDTVQGLIGKDNLKKEGEFWSSIGNDIVSAGKVVTNGVASLLNGTLLTKEMTNSKISSAGIGIGAMPSIDNASSQSAMVDALTKAIQQAGGNTSTNLVNTFKLTMPTGSALTANAVAKSLAQQLYSQFQATQ